MITEPGVLYDARRGVYYARPVLRGWLHFLCFWVSVAGGALLLDRAHGGPEETAAAVVYSASLSALFGTSALYRPWHLDRRDAAAAAPPGPGDDFLPHRRHGLPVFLLSAPAGAGVVSLIVMWALTLAAMAIRLARPSAPELVAGALFIGLGCAGGLALPWVWIHGGSASGVLIMVGGLLYIVGALSYHRRWPDPYPSVFGYHEIFHLCVCAAAAPSHPSVRKRPDLR